MSTREGAAPGASDDSNGGSRGGSRRGYEAFGSFHTPSTESLFAAAARTDGDERGSYWHATELPDPRSFLPSPADFLAAPESASTQKPSVIPIDPVADGSLARRQRELFTIDFDRWTYLNHGAFGGPTRYATAIAGVWRELADAQPLRFHDRQLFPYIVHAISALGRFLGVANARDELVLVPNATTGLHAVLASWLEAAVRQQVRAPTVVCFSPRYGAVRKMLDAERQRHMSSSMAAADRELRIHEEPLTLAESYDDERILRRLVTALDGLDVEPKATLVVIDHVTSNTGVVLPVEAIVRACHDRGIPVLVDGAHGPLNLALNLDALGADYYVGNCHKWLAAPRGVGFVHINSKTRQSSMRTTIQPRVVSHGFFDGLQSAFMWTGLQDYSPWLALPSVLAYWEHLGVEQCRGYMHDLAQAATERLYTRWGMPKELEAARAFAPHKRHAMRLVRLPTAEIFGLRVNEPGAAPHSSADAKHIQDALHGRHQIEVPVKCLDDGALYVRISAHIYNALEDYDRLADAILGNSD